MQLLAEMPLREAIPNEVTYGATISACGRGEQWQRAIQLLSEMFRFAAPNAIIFNAAISSCEKAGQWQLAVQLLSTMSEVRTATLS